MRESRARRLALAPLALLALPYGWAASLHRALYERGCWRAVRLPVPVVSVGNLTVGGSAKTPTARWLAAGLAQRGWRVALLSRGYGRRGGEPVVLVSDGRAVLLGAEQAGDEPLWLARSTPGVPVLAASERALAGRRALELFDSQVLVLDDGFQHLRLARDVDLVCVDAALGLGNGRVLPRGPLREPPAALARADALIATRARPGQPLPELPAPAAIARFALQLAPQQLLPLAGGQPQPLASLRGAAVGLLAGLARPETLRESVRAAGAQIAQERFFPDHHPYARRDVADLAPGLRWITTGKDAVKLSAEWDPGQRIEVLEEAVPRGSGEPLLEWLLERLGSPGAPVRPR